MTDIFESDPASWTLAAPFRGMPVENDLGAGIEFPPGAMPRSIFPGASSHNPDQTGAKKAGSENCNAPSNSGATPAPGFTFAGNTTKKTTTADFVPGNEEVCRRELDATVAADPNTFRIGGGVLVILRVPSKADLPSEIDWQADFPGTTLATPADIMERAERMVWRGHAGGKGTTRLVRRHPPVSFINNFLPQMRGRYSARLLAGIARVPVIDDHGEIRFVHGYDAPTGLYFDSMPTFELLAKPSLDDASLAAEALLHPFTEFKFEDQAAGEAALLAAILTAIQRPFLRTAPIFVIRSSMPGTGKGLVVRCVAWLAYGTAPVLITWGGSKEEFEKRLASILIRSPAAFSIDNANGMQIEGELLESIITEGAADIRLLGHSETVRVRNGSFVTLTGNNPSITGDMARRVIPINIEPRSANPEADVYPFDPLQLIKGNRNEYLRHAYTIMRAYRRAGMPEQTLPAVGSFDAWSRRVRDVIYWLKGYDLSDVFRSNKAEDPRRQSDGSLLAALHAHFGTKFFKSAEPISVYQRVSDTRRGPPAPPATPAEQALADAIEDVFGSRVVNARSFGYWARRVDGCHIEGFKLDAKHDPSTNSNVCTVHRS